MKYKVSVIVPIYGVVNFIARCVESLMEQTLQEVEYIFVNDATPDGSMKVLREVLSRYPHRSQSVKIVEHEANKGLPAARNTGLKYAQGEYIFHCDSDDFVEKDMLETLYTMAITQEADIVWSDWFLSFEQNERYMKQHDCATANDALKAILSGTMKYNVWNKLVKRSLYTENNIVFPAGHGMGEDMTMIRLFVCAKRVAYCPQAFYHYVKMNTGAMTAAYSEKHLSDLRYNVEQTIDFIHRKCGNEWDEYIEFFKLNVKLPFLITDRFSMYRLWSEWYTESNQYINRNKSICLRTRMLQIMAAKKQYWVVWLYYKLVQQLVGSFILRYK